jgi:hypothetical protein
MFLLLFLLGEACARRITATAVGPVVLESSGKW